MSVILCFWMFEHLQEFLVSVSFHPPSFLLDQSFWSWSLLSCTARRPRIRFPVVGPAVPPLPDLLEVFPLLVGRPGGGPPQRRDVFPRGRKTLLPLIAAGVLPRPNLLTDLVHRAEVGVVHQLHEVPVPQLLIGDRGAASAAGVQSDGGVGGQVGGGGRRRRYDLQGDAQ